MSHGSLAEAPDLMGAERGVDARKEFTRLFLGVQSDALQLARLRLGKRASSAEDVVQKAALKALQAFARFAPGNEGLERSFKAWFLTIVNNEAMTYHRKEARLGAFRNEVEEGEMQADFVSSDDHGSPEEAIATAQERELVRRAIDTIPAGMRPTIALWADGRKYREIAKELGIPIGTVMSRVNRAKTHVAKALGREAAS